MIELLKFEIEFNKTNFQNDLKSALQGSEEENKENNKIKSLFKVNNI